MLYCTFFVVADSTQVVLWGQGAGEQSRHSDHHQRRTAFSHHRWGFWGGHRPLLVFRLQLLRHRLHFGWDLHWRWSLGSLSLCLSPSLSLPFTLTSVPHHQNAAAYELLHRVCSDRCVVFRFRGGATLWTCRPVSFVFFGHAPRALSRFPSTTIHSSFSL